MELITGATCNLSPFDLHVNIQFSASVQREGASCSACRALTPILHAISLANINVNCDAYDCDVSVHHHHHYHYYHHVVVVVIVGSILDSRDRNESRERRVTNPSVSSSRCVTRRGTPADVRSLAVAFYCSQTETKVMRVCIASAACDISPSINPFCMMMHEAHSANVAARTLIWVWTRAPNVAHINPFVSTVESRLSVRPITVYSIIRALLVDECFILPEWSLFLSLPVCVCVSRGE